MIKVQVKVPIKLPKQEVFDFIANPENNPKWQGGMKKCVVTSPGPLGLGSEYQQEASFMGKPILTTFKITEFAPGHLIKGESIKSTFPITFKRIVEGDDHECEATAIVTGNPKGLMGWFPFLTRWMIRRSIKTDYQNLKKLLEQNH